MPPRVACSRPLRRLRMTPLLVAVVGCALLRPSPPSWFPALETRAATARELSFEDEPSLRLIRREALPGQLERELGYLYPGDVLVRTERAGIVIGLFPPGTHVRRAMLGLMGDVAVGFFSPTTRTIFVVSAVGRSALASGADRVVLHELVHALQAEHSLLPDLLAGLWDESDLGFALGATLEGDATWAEQRDAELRGEVPATPEALAADFHPAWIAARHPDVPRALRDPLMLQYGLGYRLAWDAASDAGAAGLDALLADPPLSSEQLLHPDRASGRSGRDAPTIVRLPETGVAPEGCPEVHRDTLGELGLRLWFAERGASEDEAERAAAGWDGDRLAVFACADGPGFVWWLRFDSTPDAREFAGSAAAWVEDLATSRGLRGPVRVGSARRAAWIFAGLPDETPAVLGPRIELAEARNLAVYLALRPGLETRVGAWRDWYTSD